MILTKYNHACFTVEHDHHTLVVDPGSLATDFIAPEHVDAVVITHLHPDHFDPQRISDIFAKNDMVTIIGPSEVIERVEIENKRVARPSELISIGAFQLQFFGGEHAEIYPSLPKVENLAVLINDLIYYPGDSLTVPTEAIDVLALPAGAPWLKTSEAIDFMLAVKPRLVFPTHDALLSDEGKAFNDMHYRNFAGDAGIDYQRLDKPIEV